MSRASDGVWARFCARIAPRVRMHRVARCDNSLDDLEPRLLLSGSDALDRLDFGNLASEAAHNFEPGLTASQMPILGTGTTGASAGLTYREPFGSGTNNPYSSQGLTFTLAVNSALQNYITVKVWGSDSDNGQMYLLNAPATTAYPFIEDNNTPPPFPNRFLYYTFPIPISMTSGQLSAQLTLNFIANYDAYGGTGYHYLDKGELTRPVYSVFSTTDPDFIPDSSDQPGSALTQTPEKSLTTLTSAQATALLVAERNSIYNSYYPSLLKRQILATSPGSPPAQVIGLDLFTDATTWGNAGKTAAQWDTQVGAQRPQPGYTALPTEMLSVLYTTYLLAPLPGVTITGEPNQYDPTVLQRIVNLLDGATYMQGLDSSSGQPQGQFPGGSWIGLVSNLPAAPTARTTGGSGDLQGVDTQALGWAIISLLNDPVGGPAFQAYLSQSYNADLTNGGSLLRASAYERMLFDNIAYLSANPGGTESQNMFEMTGLYASEIALAKLQSLYPNPSYVYAEATALNKVKMVMGLTPDTLGNTNPGSSGFTNFGLSAKGLGEANGTLSSGYDGHYGAWLTMLAPDFAALAALDPSADATTVSNLESMARATIDAFDQFIGPGDNVTVNAGGQITGDAFTLDQEDFITYRNNSNPGSNENTFNVDTRYMAANPSGPVHDAYALRSAYLEAEYGTVPAITAADTSLTRLNFLRDLPAYEATINSLVNVNPATLTALPGEPGQPDYAWADPQTGAVAFVNNGERFYMNANWRNYEFNNNSYSNLVPSEIARIDDITATTDHAAEIYLPFNSATVQSDGNLSGTMLQPWYVRYGNYLIVLNHSTSGTTAKLPAGTGEAEDLITHTFYKLGTNVIVPAGQAAIFWLAAPVVSSAADIGAPPVAGSNSYASSYGTSSAYTVTGSGAGLSGTSDSFRFVSTAVTGNVNLVAQVSSQTNTNALAQAGLMIRNGTAANAIFAAVVQTPTDGLRFEWRSTTGGAMAWSAVPNLLSPVWLKLSDSNGSVSAHYSLDDSTWTPIGSPQSLTLFATTQAGLVVSSANNTAASTAVFGGVVIGFDGNTSSANTAPTIATPASASTGMVTTTSVNLSVLGADTAGESTLKYTWQVLSGAPVTFSANATNAAKNTTVTFRVFGGYTFLVTITDAGGLSTTSTVSVTVNQTFSKLGVTPNAFPVYVASGATQTFTALALDQFGQIIIGTPTSVTWSVDAGGAGSINAGGVYTAPALTSSGSAATVRAAQSGVTSGTAAVTISGIFTNSLAIGPSTPAGTVSYSGTANPSTSTYTVSGSGSDIWVGPEQFRFLFVPFTGDGTIIAQVTDVSDGNNPDSAGMAKAGLMFRANLDNESQYATVYQTYTQGTFFQYATTNIGQPTKTSIGPTGSGTNTSWLMLVRSGNTFTGYASPTGAAGTYVLVSSQTIVMGATLDVGLVVNSRYTSLPGKLNTSTFTSVSLTGTAAAPQFANDLDIGGPDPTGSYYQTGGVATINAGGTDIFSNSDQFHYAYTPVTGNATITARVVSIVNTNTNAKAGVMIRNSLDAGSAQGATLVTAASGINFDSRTSLNGSTSETKATGFAAPYWVRITRTLISGSSYSVTSFRSPDGMTWTQIGTAKTMTMNATVYVGLAATSHDNSALTTAVFDNITVTATADIAPTPSTIVPSPSNIITGKSVTLNTLGSDLDGGGEANLTYTWSVLPYPTSTPAAVTFSASGTNAAKNTTATFTQAGTYTIQVTITDTGGLTATSLVTITVNQALTTIVVTPVSSNLSPGASQQLTAVGYDQFAKPLATQPTFTWSLPSGSGTLTPGSGNASTATYTAPSNVSTGTSAFARAAVGAINSTVTLITTNQTPLIASSVGAAAGSLLNSGTAVALSVPAVDDAGPANLSYAWSYIWSGTGSAPPAVSYSVNNSNAAGTTTATFYGAGAYTFTATVTDAGGQQTTSAIQVIVPQIYNFLGAAGDDTFRLLLDPNDPSMLDIYQSTAPAIPPLPPATPTWSIPYASIAIAVSITGSTGDDRLILDFSNGNPIPAAGLSFDGGAPTNADTVQIIGASAADAFTLGIGQVTHTSPAATFTYSNVQSLDLATGTYTFDVANGFTGNGMNLTLESGAAALVPQAIDHPSRVLMQFNSLIINPSAMFDLSNNDMIVSNTPVVTLYSALVAGQLFSSTAYTTNGLTSIGSLSGAMYLALHSDPSFDTLTTVQPTDALLKYTYRGDAYLTGTISTSDFAALDSGFLLGLTPSWQNGDYNNDGVIDYRDYDAIDYAYANQGTQLAAAASPLSPTILPASAITASTVTPSPRATASPTSMATPPLSAAPTSTPSPNASLISTPITLPIVPAANVYWFAPLPPAPAPSSVWLTWLADTRHTDDAMAIHLPSLSKTLASNL